MAASQERDDDQLKLRPLSDDGEFDLIQQRQGCGSNVPRFEMHTH